MKWQAVDSEMATRESLYKCLREVPFVEVQQAEAGSAPGGIRPDFVAKLKLPDGEKLLVVEAKMSGQPRLAREAINQMLRYKERLPEAYFVLSAPYVSPQTAELCTQEGIGYVDMAGNCRLTFGEVYIRKEGKPNPFAVKRDLRSMYSPKAERLLRVLLTNPNRRWKMQELAEEANVSLGQVANVKKLLADREWVSSERDGLILAEPEMMLKEWSKNYRYSRNHVHDFYSLKSAREIESDLAKLCAKVGIDCALTGFSGAARRAPAVRYQRAYAYVSGVLDKVVSPLNLKPVTSGANVTLIQPYDEGVFYGASKIGGALVVSPVQNYLDLQNMRGRGEEAADALLEQVIQPLW